MKRFTMTTDKYYWLWWISKSWHSIPPLNKLMLQLNADLKNEQRDYLIDTSGHNTRNSQPLVSICHWQGDLIEVQ